MLSFALVLIGMVVVLAMLVNWWEPDDRPRRLEAGRLRLMTATRHLRNLAHPSTRRRA